MVGSTALVVDQYTSVPLWFSHVAAIYKRDGYWARLSEFAFAAG